MAKSAKAKSKKFRSRLSKAIHETASGLHRAGLLDMATMREFDASCLTAVPQLSPKDIVALRKREGISQGVFALPERSPQAGERMGARREEAERPVAETAVDREVEGPRRHHLTAGRIT
jgi:hypothetical protein